MPKLKFDYLELFPGGTLRPMAKAIAINTLNGLEQEFLGLFDTGADEVSLTPDMLVKLGIHPSDLEDDQAETPSGTGLIKRCDFILIGLEREGKLYFPNGENPVPLHFSDGSMSCLLGQQGFLRNCISTFDGPGRIVTLDF